MAETLTATGEHLPPEWALQNPADYIETPDPIAANTYDRLYAEYRALHDHFGRGGNDVMHRLKDIRREALA